MARRAVWTIIGEGMPVGQATVYNVLGCEHLFTFLARARLSPMGVRVGVERGSGAVAMRSPVNWSLLGLVIQRPSYGYELVQRFERTYGDSLELSSPSQIYTALDALERKGWIEEMAPEPSTVVRQPKPHYRVTAEGLRCYREWLIAQAHEERRRSRVFARQLAMLPPADALAVIERYEHACLADASGTTPVGGPGDDGAAGLLTRLELEDDRLALEARLAWIHYARLQFAGVDRGVERNASVSAEGTQDGARRRHGAHRRKDGTH